MGVEYQRLVVRWGTQQEKEDLNRYGKEGWRIELVDEYGTLGVRNIPASMQTDKPTEAHKVRREKHA